MDLNGMDWFYNDQTGDVFYSTILRKGAEEGMTKGWQWMGENGMFSKNNDNIDNILYTDLSLVPPCSRAIFITWENKNYSI